VSGQRRWRLGVVESSLRPVAEAAIREIAEPVRAEDPNETFGLEGDYAERETPALRVHRYRDDGRQTSDLHPWDISFRGDRAEIDLVMPDPKLDDLNIAIDIQRTRSGATAFVRSVERGYHSVPFDGATRARAVAWLKRLELAAKVVEAEPVESWNLDRLENPGAHYIRRKSLRGGGVELSIDTEQLTADWPPLVYSYWNRKRQRHRELRIRINPDGRVAVYGDRAALRERWDAEPSDDFHSRLRSAMLAQVLELLPPELVELTGNIHPSLETYKLIHSNVGFRQMCGTAPLVAMELLALARSGRLVDERRSDARRNHSFARIATLVERPLREVVTAATVPRPGYSYRRNWSRTYIPSGELDPASASLVAYVRHPIAELTESPGAWEQLLLTNMVEFLKQANVDRVRELADPKSWELVRSAVSGYRSSTVLAHKVLENPQAARRAIDGYFAPHIRDLYAEDEAGVDEDVLGEVTDYLRRDPEAEELLDRAQEDPTLLPSFRKLCVASKLWHRELRHQQLDQAALEMKDDTSDFTPSPLDGLSIDRYRLRQLRSNNALQSEGERMGHCVGSYGWRCVRGESIIFSVEAAVGDDQWDGVATMELDRDYKIRQLYGPHDRRMKTEFHDLLQKAIDGKAPKKPYLSREAWAQAQSGSGAGLAA
jgi:PcfJ-like protein